MRIIDVIPELSPEERTIFEQFIARQEFIKLVNKMIHYYENSIIRIDSDATQEEIAFEFTVLKRQLTFWIEMRQVIQSVLENLRSNQQER